MQGKQVKEPEDEAYQVFKHYSQLTLPKMVFEALNGRTENTGVAVVGHAGIGKSAYVYNSIKVGYMLHLCHGQDIGLEDSVGCWEYITDEYGDICFGKACDEPDELDKKLRKYVFVGNEDIDRLNEYLKELIGGEKPRRLPVLFLDDLALKGLYHMGGRYKELHIALKRLYQFRRTLARLTIVTSPSKDDLIDVFSDFRYVYGDADFSKVWFIRWEAFRAKVTLKFHYGKFIDTYKTFYDLAWKDVIPRKSIFGMPKWLEEAIDARKRRILLDAFTRYEEAKRREEEKRKGVAKP